MTVALVKFERAKQALAEARSIDEVKLVRDQAEALRLYVRQQGESLEMQNDIAEIKLRAECRAGKLLEGMTVKGGKRHKLHDETYERHAVLDDLGISKSQSHRWQTEASVPEEIRERYIVETKSAKEELTSAGLYKLGQRLKQKEERQQTEVNAFNICSINDTYRCIVIDPPWPQQKILRDERPNQDIFDYPTMTIEEIGNLPIANLASESGCHIYLWTTHKQLRNSFLLFDIWGVNYECLMTWHKNVGFTPFSWMYDTEHVLFGRIGNLKLQQMGLRLGFEAKSQGHSIKPETFYERVILASPAPRLELFARKKRDEFVVWGDEINGMES